MPLVQVGEMRMEVLGEITEIHTKKELQHNLRAASNRHVGGGRYCDSASPRTLYEIITLYDSPTFPCL